MTALTIIQGVAAELGITVPGAVFSSTDNQVIQLRNLLNREGQALSRAHEWTELLVEKTFTTAAQAVQTSAVPSDFGWFVDNTMWNRTTDRQYDGPMNPVDWQRQQASPSASLLDSQFRFRGGDILITPDPTAGETAAYEYVTKNWAEASAGAGDLSAMTADTDISRLDEQVVILGIIWRWRSAKKLDYSEEFRTYEIEKARAIARDGGSKKHNLAGRRAPMYNSNIPESGFG